VPSRSPQSYPLHRPHCFHSNPASPSPLLLGSAALGPFSARLTRRARSPPRGVHLHPPLLNGNDFICTVGESLSPRCCRPPTKCGGRVATDVVDGQASGLCRVFGEQNWNFEGARAYYWKIVRGKLGKLRKLRTSSNSCANCPKASSNLLPI
jgi:hypothetical protein